MRWRLSIQPLELAAVAALVIFILVLYACLPDGARGQIDLPPLQRSKYDERLTMIDRESVEAAYRSQITHLFEVWMKDEHGQPQRAAVGLRKARRAYIEAMTAFEAR